MLHGLVSTASRLLNRLQRSLLGERAPALEAEAPPAPPTSYARLQRVILTDEVSRTLFSDFANHRRTSRGREEIGWFLLGLRDANEAVVLAALPAGAQRSAGVAHVQFNSTAQGVASCIVRQTDKRIRYVGVVHTHPGSLRHPSEGDYQGDSLWVAQLRGKEGVFGIGTADVRPGRGFPIGRQPQDHVQVLGELCFHWYALAEGDRSYNALPVHLALGPDLAKPLHPVWPILETHGLSLERLIRQQARVKFDVTTATSGPAILVNIVLADANCSLRLLLEKDSVQYYLLREDDLIEVNPHEADVERAVYLILAELAGQK